MTRTIYFLLLPFFLFANVRAAAQLKGLTNVQEYRFIAKTYIDKEKFDSAFFAMDKFIGKDTFVNPFDYLNFALCNYKKKDTVNFLKYLDRAIVEGVDSEMINARLRKMTGSDQLFLDSYLNANYKRLRDAGWVKYDTVLINEVKSINYFDQFVRNEVAQMTGGKADSNFWYMLSLSKQTDSINYVRVARLLAAGRFPGYHNCGAFASLFATLIHLGDHHEEQWAYLLAHLKSEVLAGNISPDEVATIADNHYERGSGKLCSYYGYWTGRTTELCDCKNVDRYRQEIGMEDLQTEYSAKGKKIPECYKVK